MSEGETPCYKESNDQTEYNQALKNLTPEEQEKIKKIRKTLIESSKCEKNDPENGIDPADILRQLEYGPTEIDIVKLALELKNGTINSGDIETGSEVHRMIQYAMINYPDSAATIGLLAGLNKQ